MFYLCFIVIPKKIIAYIERFMYFSHFNFRRFVKKFFSAALFTLFHYLVIIISKKSFLVLNIALQKAPLAKRQLSKLISIFHLMRSSFIQIRKSTVFWKNVQRDLTTLHQYLAELVSVFAYISLSIPVTSIQKIIYDKVGVKNEFPFEFHPFSEKGGRMVCDNWCRETMNWLNNKNSKNIYRIFYLIKFKFCTGKL